MNNGQKQIDIFFKENNWPYWSTHENFTRLVEEVGELARLINHEYGPKPRRSDEADQNIEGEIGDILFSLACLANIHNIDLDQALEKSITKVATRDKNRFK